MARVIKENGKVALSKAINRLIEGDYDTPIEEVGSFSNRLTLGRLNVLRIKLRDQRDEDDQKEEKLKMEIASIAHDLKTPLTVISGYAECAEDGLDDKNYLSLISKSAIQMNDQICSFLDNIKKEIKSTDQPPKKINAREFFTVEIEKYKNIASNFNIKLVVGRIPKVTLYCVENDLKSVFLNLISNAFKYSGEKKKIRITFSSFHKVFSVKIRDYGNGIKKTDLPYIFDRFFTADKARSDTNSSGLGLYIVKKTIDKMNGRIFVENKEGKGTCFKVCLPWEDDNIDVQLNKIGKSWRLIVTVLFGWISTSIIRFMQYSRTGKVKYLIAGLLLIPFFFVGWFADIFSVFVSGKFTLLMEE